VSPLFKKLGKRRETSQEGCKFEKKLEMRMKQGLGCASASRCASIFASEIDDFPGWGMF